MLIDKTTNSMKYTIYLFSILMVVTLGFSSCDKDCENQNVSFTSLETAYGCNNTPYQIDINLQETYTIIRTQAEFDNQVTGSCIATIDFNMYDLIIGKKGLSSGFSSITYEVIENCTTGNYEIGVNIQSDATTIAPNITYHVLIPKLGDEQTATVDVNVLY